MWLNWALNWASKINGPFQLAAFVTALLVFGFLPALKSKKPRFALSLFAVVLLAIALAGLASSTYLKSIGLYHIRIIVLGTDGQPKSQTKPTASAGGEMKQANGNWEFDMPPQNKPSDGKVTFYAQVEDAYLSGTSTLELKDDYYPTVTIQLAPKPPATIRGTVVDESGRSVAGARVSVVGYSDIATTDEMGNFSLPSHHADGQSVSLRAEKDGRVANEYAIAGREAQLVLHKPQ
jgi:hypothetical protein